MDEDRSPWYQLCALLGDEDEADESSALVDAALATDDDPVEALLSGLDDQGALAYLEPEDSGMELADALRQLPRVVEVQPDLDEANDTDDLDDAIRVADRTLAKDELRLVRIEEPDSEAVVLVVVQADAVSELVELARRLAVPLTAA